MKCTAVDFLDGYNHGREKRLSIYWKGSTYSTPTECKHFNPSFLADFTALKTTSGYSCNNNMEVNRPLEGRLKDVATRELCF